jgi:hypothetical protein
MKVDPEVIIKWLKGSDFTVNLSKTEMCVLCIDKNQSTMFWESKSIQNYSALNTPQKQNRLTKC